MSHNSKISSQREAIDDSLTNRFRDSLSYNNGNKKLDSKEVDAVNSPVSPLTTRSFSNNAVTSSSSSSSSSSGSIKTPQQTHFSKDISETSPVCNFKPGHRRSMSAGAPLIYSGSSFSSASSNGSNLISSSNLVPSGNVRVLKTGLPLANKTEILGTRTGNYGHGSIMRGGNGNSNKLGNGSGSDPEELKRAGNEMYRKGNFVKALAFYDKAILLAPDNAAYRSNRAAALTAIGKLGEAVRECEEAVRLDPAFARAHQRLASLYLRLGQTENARQHFCFHAQQQDSTEIHKLQSLEKHINRCAEARKIGDWKGSLRESYAAITVGADSSPQLVACKAEALLKLHQLEDADSTISNIPKFEYYPRQAKFFGMISEAYVLYVQAQIEMALGRFENAVSVAAKAGLIDNSNVDIAMVLNSVKMVARARNCGNDLFSSGRYAEASSAYGEGLKYAAFNPVLYCNRAVCWSKLGLWEKSIEDCNQALRIQPNYTKALFRRAASNGKLGRWTEAVKDYEFLRKELPGDNEVLESLHQAQIALKKSHGIHKTIYGGEVEDISSLDKFKTAISSPGVSIVHYKAASDEQSEDISPFINMLCIRYPSVHFLKVDVEESLAVAKAECIRTVPTFQIYKNGEKVKEIIRPSHQLLEDSVRSCSL